MSSTRSRSRRGASRVEVVGSRGVSRPRQGCWRGRRETGGGERTHTAYIPPPSPSLFFIRGRIYTVLSARLVPLLFHVHRPPFSLFRLTLLSLLFLLSSPFRVCVFGFCWPNFSMPACSFARLKTKDASSWGSEQPVTGPARVPFVLWPNIYPSLFDDQHRPSSSPFSPLQPDA